jgi:multisubunit Na+/H+ antiporter MnhF subunit
MSPVRACSLLFLLLGIVMCVVGVVRFVRGPRMSDLVISGFCVLGLLGLLATFVWAVRIDEKTCTITELVPPEDAEHSVAVRTEQCGELVPVNGDAARLEVGHTYRLRVWGVFGSGFVESVEAEVPR